MEIGQLKIRLGQILAEEEGDGFPDWQSVRLASDQLLGELRVPLPLIVEEYLRGSERRRQDVVFAHAQRTQLVEFLRDASAQGTSTVSFASGASPGKSSV